MKKTEHSVISNLVFLLKKSYEFDKQLIFSVIIRIPINILLPLITAYLSKVIVTLVLQNAPVYSLIFIIISLTVLLLIMNLLNKYVTAKIKYDSMFVRLKYLGLIADKNMNADFQNVENPEGQLKAQKAKNAVYSGSSGTEQLFDQLVSVLSNGIGLIIYSIIIMRFNVAIVILLIMISTADYFVGVRFTSWQHKNKNQWADYDRKLRYIDNKAGDYKAGKDLRLYNMSEWFNDLFKEFFESRVRWFCKEESKRLVINWISILLAFLRDGIAFGLLIYKVSTGKLDVSDFIFYFTLITQYSTWIFGLMNNLVALKATSFNAADVREFLEMPDGFNKGVGEALPDETCEISLRDITYKYPGTDKSILDRISFKIKKGEKIAIVGNNGAGKSTLIKVICGLYTPEHGDIYFNNNQISDFNINEFYKLFSVVFQDIYIMPTTIAKNITLSDTVDINKLNQVMELSGIKNLIDKLPEHENTLLLRGVQERGIELSGGEKQKLAIARALYKNGQIVILDEPTAALDPIAENEIYLKYSELTEGRTSIFISHRLASTKFCDRIILLDNGRIVEEGTHDELIKLNGKYAEMFRVQSQYYKKGEDYSE